VRPTRRILLALASLALVTALGTIGYVLVEGWSFLDALYMTVTTLATVGYREVAPLSSAGQIYTMVLIVTGVGTTLYLLTSIAEIVLEGRLRDFFQGTVMQRSIDRLQGHVIVCGYGRFGRVVVEELRRRATEIVVIDVDASLQAELGEAGIPFVAGSAASDVNLDRAGIRRARALVVGTPSDSDNVFITLSARELNPRIQIHARGESEPALRRLRQAGADQVTSPYHLGGVRTAASIVQPSVVEFLELSAARTEREVIDLEEIRIGAGSPLCGRALGDLERENPRLRIVALKRASEPMRIAPDTDAVVASGDHVVVIGERAILQKLSQLAQAEP
jgi:voltage-gated potassium channel